MILKKPSFEVKNNTSYPKLIQNIKADVVIIGGGITGIFNAYLLAKSGIKVVVLERDENILQNATLYTTALITKLIDTSFDQLVSILGIQKAELIWQSGQDAISLIVDIVRNEAIDCDFALVPIYTYAIDKKQFKKLTREYGAVKKSGFEARLQEDGRELHFKNSGFLEIPQQAKFHPIKFTQALADIAVSLGANIFTNSEVTDIENLTVKTKTGQVTAKDILIATYRPFTNEGTHFRKAMYVTYVYELEIAKNVIPEGLYLDMKNPYHYFRIDGYENIDRMIVGGEDHRKDIKINPDKNFNALEKYIKTLLGNNTYNITRKWDGQILESIDGLPLIGAIKPHIFVATAFSGNGMTNSAISATIIRDAILNNKNTYTDVYSIKRVPSLKQLTVKGFDYGFEFLGGAFKNFFSSKVKI